MLSKNKLDSLNIQEIDNLQAESISGGSFTYARNGRRGTQVDGNRVVINSYRRGARLDLVNTNPGAHNEDDIGHQFRVEFFGGTNRDNLLRTDTVRFGQAAGVAPSGTARIVVNQARPLDPADNDPCTLPARPSQADRVSIAALCNPGPS